MLMHGDFHNMTMSEPGKCSPGTARKLRETLNNLFFRSAKTATNNNNLNSVIETDYLNDISEAEQEHLRRKGIYTTGDNLPFSLSGWYEFIFPNRPISAAPASKFPTDLLGYLVLSELS